MPFENTVLRHALHRHANGSEHGTLRVVIRCVSPDSLLCDDEEIQAALSWCSYCEVIGRQAH